MVKLLILGGTTEAAELARAVGPGVDLTSSLAGRAGQPKIPGRIRIGGFGGAAGLEAYLRAEGFDAVIDATHPFAARISDHARRACAALGIRRLALLRPLWERAEGDHWIEAASMAEAVRLLPGLGRRVFLTVGAGEVGAFAGLDDVWFLVRLLKDERLALPHYAVVTGRPPFPVSEEMALMQAHAVELLVTKASGGAATHAKIEAARRLGLPVLMIRRPPPPEGETADSVAEAVEWLLPRP